MLGKPAPVIELPDLRDLSGTVSATDLAGRPFLVNVFASWCAPCWPRHRRWPFSPNRSTSSASPIGPPRGQPDLLDQYGDPFVAIGVDRDGDAGMAWGVYGVPETFLVGGDGTILMRHAGPIDRRVLEEVIMPAIGEVK